MKSALTIQKMSLSKGRRAWLIVLLLTASLMLNACAPVANYLTIASATTEPAEANEPQITLELAEPAEEAAAGVLLEWKGALSDGACGQVTVDAEGAGAVALCNSEDAGTEWLPNHQTEWEQISAHFGELSYMWPDETFVLHGEGSVEDELWAVPLGTWARFVYEETHARRAGAALRTALAWQISDVAEDAEICGRLLVMRYGYAYAMLEPCEGGESEALAEGWLTNEEMARFIEWGRDLAPLYVDINYLEGQGEVEADDAEIEAIVGWVETVFTRLAGE